MVKTVIGLFATSAIAHNVVSDLENQGFPRDDIHVIPEAGTEPAPTATMSTRRFPVRCARSAPRWSPRRRGRIG